MDTDPKVRLILELVSRMKSPLTEAKRVLNRDVGEMKNRLEDLKLSHVKAFRAMEDELPQFSRVMGLMSNPYALATAGAVAIGAAAYKAGQWSNDWANGMAKVNMTTQLSKDQLSQLSDQLIDIGKKNVLPLEEIPNAFNMIVSSGLDVKQSLAALDPTLKAAKAGFSDVYTVANAGTSIMLASGENINRVYDIMFATVNKGKAEFSDMANYLPRAVSASKGLGFSLDEVGGAFATLTQKFKAEQASTLLENVFRAFGTGSVRKNMEQFGVKVFDKGKIRPFATIIQDIAKSINGLSNEGRSKVIEKMGFDMEARNAILSMITNVKDLKANTDYATNSAGEMARAYKATKQPMDEWKELMNGLKADVIKPLGDAVLALAVNVGHWVASMIKGIRDVYNESAILKPVIGNTAKGAGYLVSGLGEWFITADQRKKDYQAKGSENITNLLAELKNPSSLTKDRFDELIKRSNDWEKQIYDRIQTEQAGNGNLWARLAHSEDFYNLNYDIGQYGTLQQLRKDAYSKIAGKANPFAAATEKNTNTDTGTPPVPTGLDKVTGNSQASHNITINIDAFVKGGITQQVTTSQQTSMDQLESMFKDMWLRMIANVQTSSQ